MTQKFTTKELDQGIDLTQFPARFYDQDLGTWISVDPRRQYASGYTYCGNNPVNCVDPDGRAGGPASVQGGLNMIFPAWFQNGAVKQVQNLPQTTLNAAGTVNSGVNLTASGLAFIPILAPEALAVVGATDVAGVAINWLKVVNDPNEGTFKDAALGTALFGAGKTLGARGEEMQAAGRATQIDVQRGEASSGVLSHWVEFLFGSGSGEN